MAVQELLDYGMNPLQCSATSFWAYGTPGGNWNGVVQEVKSVGADMHCDGISMGIAVLFTPTSGP